MAHRSRLDSLTSQGGSLIYATFTMWWKMFTRRLTNSRSPSRRGPCPNRNHTLSGYRLLYHFDVEYKEEKYSLDYDAEGPVTSIVKHWLVPGLGCFELKKETVWTRDKDGTLIVDTTHQAISVKFQAVDQFFLVPTDYTERSPGEIFLERNRLYPNDFPLPGDMAAYDQSYSEAHRRLPKP